MSELASRIASLSPEKRRLLESLQAEREAAPIAAATVETGPFSLLNGADRSKLPPRLEDAYPLAMLQLGMIYHMELSAAHRVPAYHNVNGFYVKGTLDLGALQRAVDTVVARHANLRSSFDLERYSEPMQLIHHVVRVPIRVQDLRALTRPAQLEIMARFFAAENRRLFDLTTPPLLRIHVHVRDDLRFHFTLTEPHAISEGWSTTAMLAEVSDFYLALRAGGTVPADRSPQIPYREFVRLEREAIESEESRLFWQQKLAALPAAALARWPRRSSSRAASRKPSFVIPDELLRKLRQLASESGTSLKSVLLAAHLKVLSLWSGERRVVTGVEFNGRPERLGGDSMRGVFINTLPVAQDLGQLCWLELAERCFAAEIEILPHRRYPAALLQRQRLAPLYEASFNYLHFHGVSRVFDVPDLLLINGAISDESVSNFPLAANFHLAEGSANVLSLLLEYDDRQFSRSQIAAMWRTYLSVFTTMTSTARARHDAAVLLSGGELHQLLREWNPPQLEIPGYQTMAQWLAASAAASPDSIAVLAGEDHLSYGRLSDRSGHLAKRLRELGAGPDQVVGLCLERSCELIIGLVGILEAGAAYLPLDPSYPRERLAWMAEDARSRLVVTSSRLASQLPSHALRPVLIDPLGEERIPSACSGLLADHLAYVIYTSGSTGRPKGVMISHRTLVLSTLARAQVYREPVQKFLLLSSFAFDSSVAGIFGTLTSGGTLALPEVGAERDPEVIANLVSGLRISHLLALPSLYALLLDQNDGDLDALRVAIVAGESCSAELVTRHRSHLGGAELYNEYGPTEATVWSSAFRAEVGEARERVPIGRPIPGWRLYVVDDRLGLLAAGVPGELLVGGRGLARGYLERPRLSAERFLPDPFSASAGQRFYRTGDLARWLPDGNVEFLGRRDHQIKLRGFRVELEEIETVLGQHPEIGQAVVVALQDPRGTQRLAAYVVGRDGAALAPATLREFLRRRLPEYMVPAHLVPLAALPLTPNGKVDRKALADPTALGSEQRASSYVAPASALEQALAELWSELLGVSPIGMHDDFFDLGGDSLLMIQLHRRQRSLVGSRVALAQMFAAPTLASVIALAEGVGVGPAFGKEVAERLETRRSLADQRQQLRELRKGRGKLGA